MSIRIHHSNRSRGASLLVGAALILTSLGAPAAALADPIVQGDDTLLPQVAADVTKPTVAAPKVRFAVGGVFGADDEDSPYSLDRGAAGVLITLAGSDAESGVSHYSVQRREDGHGYRIVRRMATGAYAPAKIQKGHSYRFRVRAIDAAGNASAWKETPVIRLGVVSDNSSRIRYSGSWKHVGNNDATGDSLKASKTAGSVARLTFRGRAVAWVAPVGPTRGSAKVYIDGELISTIDLYEEACACDPDHAPPTDRLIKFTKTFSKVGTHQIAVKVLGTAGHPRVDVDAFLVID